MTVSHFILTLAALGVLSSCGPSYVQKARAQGATYPLVTASSAAAGCAADTGQAGQTYREAALGPCASRVQSGQ
ncbi:hypothetical protein TRIHO_34020 [Tritonibacter horizontis]|uniref:Lipoprotein n=1 Tax=Tritonibacter horizontis TaxID=1768241 RepID=A0A132BTQ0_9RHOB|nr:hypothetical protein TRIHO_34020 [Tritonibacter horizontis]